MTEAQSQSAPKPLRWFHPTPDRLVLLLLVVECLLWLSERCGWPAWHKGYAVLTGLATVGVAMLGMVAWFIVSLIFRWRFQFSICLLLVLTVAVAVPCSWLAVEMKKAREQHEAVGALGLADSGMYYAHQHEGNLGTSPLLGPDLLRSLLGDDFLRQVDWVNLNGSQLTPDQWQHFEKLATIRVLYMCDARVGDADLIHFRNLKGLTMLHLIRTQVTDAGVEQLGTLTMLRDLSIWDSRVTDAGVAKLQQALPNCKITR